MEIELINGRFSISEAQQLLTEIIQAKIAFHEKRVRILDETEEDIKHSERRIKSLQESLQNIYRKISEKGIGEIDLRAHIEISFAPRLN